MSTATAGLRTLDEVWASWHRHRQDGDFRRAQRGDRRPERGGAPPRHAHPSDVHPPGAVVRVRPPDRIRVSGRPEGGKADGLGTPEAAGGAHEPGDARASRRHGRGSYDRFPLPDSVRRAWRARMSAMVFMKGWMRCAENRQVRPYRCPGEATAR